MKRKGALCSFPYYGGKYTHLPFILSTLREVGPGQHFVDVFGGSAAVTLNVDPYPIETVNDLNGELVNFFRMLRTHRERVIEDLRLTPYAREEYELALDPDLRCVSELERARRWYIRARMTLNSMPEAALPCRWAKSLTTSRRGMSRATAAWLGGVEELWAVAERLRRVQLDHLPAEDCIALYDGPDTTFYIDPPYSHDSRAEGKSYGAYEMGEKAHRRLAEQLHAVKGRVVLSGYPAGLFPKLYGDWPMRLEPPRAVPAGRRAVQATLRAEAVWYNKPHEKGRVNAEAA